MAALMAGALPPLHQDASSIPVSKWDSNPLLPATVWVPQTQIVHFQPHMIRTTYTCLIPILGPMLWVSTSAQVRQSSLGFLNVGFGLLGPLTLSDYKALERKVKKMAPGLLCRTSLIPACYSPKNHLASIHHIQPRKSRTLHPSQETEMCTQEVYHGRVEV